MNTVDVFPLAWDPEDAAKFGTPADFILPTDAQIAALTSITPAAAPFISKPGPVPAPPALPVTTIFVAGLGYPAPWGTPSSSGVWAISPKSAFEAPPVTQAFALPYTTSGSILTTFQPQQNGIAAYQPSPPGVFSETPQPVYIYVLCSVVQTDTSQHPPSSTAVSEVVFRYQMNSNPPYQPAGFGNPAPASFIYGSVGGTPVLVNPSPYQGIACRSDGVLAVADGPTVWLFDAVSGEFWGAGSINLNAFTGNNVLPWAQSTALALGFGPDGNLYVLAGQDYGLNPPPDGNGGAVLRFTLTGNSVNPNGAAPGSNPVVIPSQWALNVGLAVGGSAQEPAIYVVGTTQYGPQVLAFTGSGQPSRPNFALPYPDIAYSGPCLFNVYGLVETFPAPGF